MSYRSGCKSPHAIVRVGAFAVFCGNGGLDICVPENAWCRVSVDFLEQAGRRTPQYFAQIEPYGRHEQLFAPGASDLFTLHVRRDHQVLAAFGIWTTLNPISV